MNKEVKQEQGEQLARLGWQEIDCPICGGGARAFPKQEQGEPVGKFAKFTDGIWREVTDGSAGVPLYTHSKEWVGLTDNQLVDLVIKHAGFPTKLAEAIEAKLKEKNA